MSCENGRAGGIRTHDPYTPSVVRYQTALQPVPCGERQTNQAKCGLASTENHAKQIGHETH